MVCVWGQDFQDFLQQSGLRAIRKFSLALPHHCLSCLQLLLAQSHQAGPTCVLSRKISYRCHEWSWCHSANHLDREKLNPIFLWELNGPEMLTALLISTLTLQSVLTYVGDDSKAWMCLLPIAYQSDTNDYCSGEGLNLHHLKESSFIYFLFPFLTSFTLH